MLVHVKLDNTIKLDPTSFEDLMDSITEKIEQHYSAEIDSIIDKFFSDKDISLRIAGVVDRLIEHALRNSDLDGNSFRNDNYYSKKITEHIDKHISDYLSKLKEDDFKNMLLSRLISKMK